MSIFTTPTGRRLRWMQQERQIEQIASNFCALLSDKLGDTLPLTLGTFTK